MTDGCEECKSCHELKLKEVKVDGVLERILERMNEHDDDEKLKRKERKEEARARRNNFLTIILALFGVALSFGIWLNNFTHSSNLRFQKIEGALGIEQMGMK